MNTWVWVVEDGRRCFVKIVRYIGKNQTYRDTYVVMFANGDTRAYPGAKIQEWNEGA